MTTATFDLMKYRPEDGGILDCWMDLYASDWLYVTGYECWYKRTATHWAKDERQCLQHQIQALMNAMNKAATDALLTELAQDEDDQDESLISFLKAMCKATKRSKSRVASVEGMAQAQRAVAASMLDAGNVLNLRNGTLDLDTLTLRPHDPADHLTYCLDYDYDPQALAPRYEQFLQEVLGDYDNQGQWVTDLDLCLLFQELFGYSLTNDTKHEVMTWLSGEGGNGKTVAITVILWLLGALSCSVDFQSIGLPGNYDIAEIPGKRVIFSTESERGGKLAEGYVKRIVSGERINARAIYGKPFEFKSQAKVWWAMNDKPVIKDTGNSIWRRLKLIPFNRTFTNQDKDPDLLNKLESELPGILNFALDGLRRLRLRGRFPESKAVQEAVNEYRKESNPVAQWLDERTEPINQPYTAATALYADYCAWCGNNGRQAMNSNNFSRELTKLKIDGKKLTNGKFYYVKLK